MRLNLLLLLTLLVSRSSALAQIVITPSTPQVVNQGGTYKFTANVAVTWSMAPGSRGSIDSDGTYHAPPTVTAQQSIGGCQLLPNNHIINTRIDSLPINSNSTTWIASMAGPFVGVLYGVDVPVNYVNGSTPTQKMVFQYTAASNGPFTFPGYPNGKIQGGWLSDLNYDHHMYIVNPSTCGIQEIYDYYPVGTNSAAPTTNSVSGLKYQNSDYSLPLNGATDAAGMAMEPMQIHFQEWQNAVNTGGTINHAIRFTLPAGEVAKSSYLWPATQGSFSAFGNIPYGARIRLKSSYDISGFSPAAQALLKQAQQYGFILDDIGNSFDVPIDYTKLPYAYQHAIYPEIAHSNIATSDFEFVDESSLEVSAASGVTTGAEAVCATNGSGAVCQNVVLTGISVGIPQDQLYIQAGSPPQQLLYFINGDSTNSGVTWTMSPSVGTLTKNGLYTPPSTLAINTAAQITVTSNTNKSISATMTLVVLTSGTIRIIMGGPCGPGLTYYVASSYGCTTMPFVDAGGNAWQAETGDDGGGWWSYARPATFPNLKDIYLYETPYLAPSMDMRFDLIVPNGAYSITGKFDVSQPLAVGSTSISLEAQGVVQYSNVDILTSSGGEYQPVDFTLPATVTNGNLSFVLRFIKGPATAISALEIAPAADATDRPAPPTSLTLTSLQ